MPKPLITLKQDGHRIELFPDPNLPTGEGYVAHDNGKSSMVATIAANAARKHIVATLQEIMIPDGHLTATYNASGLLTFPSDNPQLSDHDWSELWELDNAAFESDGYSPMGVGVVGPKGSKLNVLKIEDKHPDHVFNRWHEITVTFEIEHLNGTKTQKKAEFFREQSENLETLNRLQRYLERELKTPIIDAANQIEKEGHSREKSPNIEPAQMRNAFWRMADFMRGIANFEKDLEPLGEIGRALRFALAYQAEETSIIGAMVREAQLVITQEKKARSGTKSSKAGEKGGGKSGAKKKKHADAWHKQFGEWLAPEVKTLLAKSPSGVSREKVAGYAEDNWPKQGFRGSEEFAPQKKAPSREHLMKIIKNFDVTKVIDRRSPPRGRKQKQRT